MLHRMEDFSRAQQRLGRNAAPIETDAAEIVALDDSRLKSELGGANGGNIAAGAGANDEDVERSIRHAGLRSWVAGVFRVPYEAVSIKRRAPLNCRAFGRRRHGYFDRSSCCVSGAHAGAGELGQRRRYCDPIEGRTSFGSRRRSARPAARRHGIHRYLCGWGPIGRRTIRRGEGICRILEIAGGTSRVQGQGVRHGLKEQLPLGGGRVAGRSTPADPPFQPDQGNEDQPRAKCNRLPDVARKLLAGAKGGVNDVLTERIENGGGGKQQGNPRPSSQIHTTIITGFSISCLNAPMSSAPSAPSTER